MENGLDTKRTYRVKVDYPFPPSKRSIDIQQLYSFDLYDLPEEDRMNLELELSDLKHKVAKDFISSLENLDAIWYKERVTPLETVQTIWDVMYHASEYLRALEFTLGRDNREIALGVLFDKMSEEGR